ncbi:uncharacterized protein LOC143280934 isoform X2 [Babylonia areolata]|uniref:uncharacterized protein LOC143280934 isoform X2 n=1 Tax=Babylonia areolata TaxID=304850 RepID=UPI003FD444C9
MERKQDAGNEVGSKSKKLKLSSRLAGKEKSKSKKAKKIKRKKFPQKKHRRQQFATAVQSVSNDSKESQTVTVAANSEPTAPNPFSSTGSITASSAPALTFSQQMSGLSMSLDRSMQRDSDGWGNSDSFANDSFGNYSNGQGGGMYTDFSHDWSDPRRASPFMNNNPRNRWQNEQHSWQQGGHRSWYGSDGPRGRFHGGQGRADHQGWSSWGPDNHGWQNGNTFLRPHSAESWKQSRPSKSQSGWDQGSSQSFSERGSHSNQWRTLTKQFGNSHFHREGADSQDWGFPGGSHAPQADSSGLEDSGSSGAGGRKRPRSLDRGGQLSKSSRAEKLASRSYDIYIPNSSRALSVSDLNTTEVQKPDSTSKQGKAQKPQATITKGIKSVNGSGIKAGPLGMKKKQNVLKHKAASSTSSSVSNVKTAVEVAKTNESDGVDAGEGVLERAERICKELREKRRKSAPSQASLNAQRVGALRSVLNTSKHRFNLAHKSFLRDYMSDSNSTLSKSPAGDNATVSSTQKKSFSASTTSEIAQTAKSISSTLTSTDSGADTAASSGKSNSQTPVSDIDRIRHSIESSVMAEGRVRRTSVRERSSSGNRSPAVTVSSSALHSSAPTTVGASSHAGKPPLPLSKDALAKMVNAPRSRTQRLQLARILRQHTAATAVRPRHIQLEGLYDDDDGDSIGDVLKNISGLEEIGECAELRNIKLEDLTVEDKLRIAQMIEEADPTGRSHHADIGERGEETPVPQVPHRLRRTRTPSLETVSRETEASSVNRPSRSPHRLQTASPSPSRPLSLDDLSTENRSRQEDSADTVLHPPTSVDTHFSSPTVTSLRSGSPVRPSPVRSSSPRASPTHPLSPRRSAERVGDSSNISAVRDADAEEDTVAYQARGSTSRRSPSVPMDTSDAPTSSTPTWRQSSPEAGVLHEVKGLCQRQDTILSEMRAIDNELCGMYKNLIEIVARMSGLQRRRVQLQTEGEQLSQQRNDLLSGIYPNTSISLDKEPSSAREERRQRTSSEPLTNPASFHTARESEERSSRKSVERMEEQAASGPSVILPSWLNAASSSSSTQPADRVGSRQETAPLFSSADYRSDICFSGSVTSTVGSATPQAVSHSSSLNNSVDSVQEVALRQPSALSAKPSSSDIGERAGRVMLSINGAVDSSGDRDVTVSSVSSVATEASHSGLKNRIGADSSSGIGSSVSTNSHLRKSLGSPLTDSGTPQNLSSTHSSQEEQSKSVQPTESSRFVIHPFASPNPSHANSSQGQSASQPKSPGVSVAYLGALSSDLVQQIVRSLPFTSQLGEANKPSMYVVRPGTSAPENQSQDAGVRSTPAEDSVTKSRIRTTSAHSVSSELSSGEQSVQASIPPLKLREDSDKAGSKTCTPRSESDAHSITSGTSLGEQIKLFSERNSFSQDTAPTLSGVGPPQEDNGHKASQSNHGMPECSVVLERLDMDSITIISDSWRPEDETDRKKKRKSRKDRDQSLQRRRRYMTESSSDGEEGERTPVDDGYPSILSSAPQPNCSTLPDGVEKMEADCGIEAEDDNLNHTLVGSRERMSQDGLSEDEVVGSSQAANSTLSSLSPSRLKLNPENLKTFRANVRQNLTIPSAQASEASIVETTAEGSSRTTDQGSIVSKESVRMSGPCAPVTGLCVHNNTLYACFQRIGINSYTLKGELTGEYPMADAQCFTITPVGSGSQHYLAVGCADHLTFLSINDHSVVSSLDTVVKVMCVLVVDTCLFAGLDSGAVIVVSLTTLQETRRFQASDCAVQSMAWTREGSTRLLTVASQDANIHVIDASSGLPVRIISGHSKTAFALLMLDHFVLSGSGDRKVMAHNVHNATFAWELHDHKGIVTSICVDNGLLFTAGYDKIIRCYDLKSRKLLHLMYGAGKCIIMKMTIHNSILYTGNRDGKIEAIDLRDMGSFACECVSCSAVYGLKEHLWHHLVADHLLPNTPSVRCPWSDCSVMLDTHSAPAAGEHLRRHIYGGQPPLS